MSVYVRRSGASGASVSGASARINVAPTPLFTATPDDVGATAAMTTNCGQLPTPNSVIGAATLTTASHRALPVAGADMSDV